MILVTVSLTGKETPKQQQKFPFFPPRWFILKIKKIKVSLVWEIINCTSKESSEMQLQIQLNKSFGELTIHKHPLNDSKAM